MTLKMALAQRLALFKTGMQLGWRGRIPFAARFAMYATVTGIFASVYRLTNGQSGTVHATVAGLAWYSGMTEALVIVSGRSHAPLVLTIRDGQFGIQFVHPLSPVARHFWLTFGEMLLQWLMLLAFGAPWLWLVSGGAFAVPALAWASLLPLGGMAIALRIRVGFCIGIAEIYGPYATPMAWFMGKFVFLFGGLLLPLDFYPDKLRHALALTPFPSMLYAPASRALDGLAPDFGGLFCMQLFWFAVTSAIAIGLGEIAIRRLQKTGE